MINRSCEYFSSRAEKPRWLLTILKVWVWGMSSENSTRRIWSSRFLKRRSSKERQCFSSAVKFEIVSAFSRAERRRLAALFWRDSESTPLCDGFRSFGTVWRQHNLGTGQTEGGFAGTWCPFRLIVSKLSGQWQIQIFLPGVSVMTFGRLSNHSFRLLSGSLFAGKLKTGYVFPVSLISDS